MIRRRDMPLVAAARGIALWSGSAIAQTKIPEIKPSSPPPNPVHGDEKVHRVLAPIRNKHRVPGLIGAIVVGDRLAAVGACGIRKFGAPDGFLTTDQVHLGSCTKAMTATLFGTLIDEGKLSSESTISQVFPQVSPKINADFRGVTLLQLLTHRAGLPANGAWWLLFGKNTTEKRRMLLATTLTQAPRSRPGSAFGYSNVGYALAALMAEQVTGESWETLMHRRLFEPLGMTSAGFGPPGQPGQVDQPWGHHRSGKSSTPTQLDNPAVMGPAGTVHCSMTDWAKFAALHLRAAQGETKLLKLATFKVLQTPQPGTGYACGWVVAANSWGGGGRTLWHNGSNTVWYATISIAPARNFAILVAANQGDASAIKACDEAALALIEVVASLTR